MECKKLDKILCNPTLLKELEECRDEKETSEYLKQNGLNLNQEELCDLKEAYLNETADKTHLSLEQLDKISGGNFVKIDIVELYRNRYAGNKYNSM